MSLTTGLVAYYKLNESSGNAADSTGNGNTLTNYNTATYAPGKINNGVVLNAGSNQYLALSNVETLFGTNPTAWSNSVWFKNSNKENNPNIIGDYYSTSGGDNDFSIDLYIGTDGRVFCDCRSGGINYSCTSWTYDHTNFGDNVWHHAVAVMDKSIPIMKIYVDGILRDSVAINGSADYFSANAQFQIGRLFYNNASTQNFTGTIDEIACYNRALTASEVTQLYNGGNGLPYPFNLNAELISYYKLDESSGDAADSVGSNTLTNTNVTYAAGKLNNGAVFANSNCRLDSSSIVFGAAGSISGWFNTDSTSNQTIMDGSGAALGPNLQIFSSKLYWGVKDGTGNFVNTTYNLSTGVWYHFVGTWNGTNIKLYVNAQTPISTANTNNPGTSGIKIGAEHSNTSFWNGKFDELGYWNRELSADEVSQLYNSNRALAYPLTAPTLYGGVAYYKLDEASGNAADSIGVNTGTNTNSVTYSSTNAKINNGAVFNGTTSYLALAAEITTPTSFAFWYYAASQNSRCALAQANYTVQGHTDGKWLIYDGTGNKFFTTPIRNATLTHVAFVYNGSAYLLYENGSYVETVTSAKVSFTSISRSTANTAWNGTIDEIAFFNRALTSTEISTLYNAGAGLQYPWAVASGPVGLKTWNGIPATSIKNHNDLLWSSIKSWNNLT